MSIIAVTSDEAGTFPRGIHPPEAKHFAEDAPIEILPTPDRVAVPLLQHTGAPAEPVVKPRQEVALGEMIGRAAGFISAAVHAPVAGKTAMPSVATLPNARHVRTIPIKAGEQELAGQALYDDVLGGDWPASGLDRHDPPAIAASAAEAGLVGLGGAAFPTHVKLTRNEARPIDTLLVNGCECEPYLTSDYRLMFEAPRAVVAGALLAARATGAEQIIVAIENNKQAAIGRMREAAEATGVQVTMLNTKYPQGGERQAILTVLDREVPTGGLPLDVGVVVINVGTAAALARAVLRGRPLTHRIVTVTGAGIKEPKNVLVPIGSSYRALIDFCGGLKAGAVRVVAGGPMTGFAVGDLDTPVTKGTGGVVVLTAEDVARAAETPCVRCGRCRDVCPMNRVPTKIALAAKAHDWELARRYHITACIECGCCGYVCPASIPLVQLIRTGKAELPREEQAKPPAPEASEESNG
jgi:electron transport complex protein RnfC